MVDLDLQDYYLSNGMGCGFTESVWKVLKAGFKVDLQQYHVAGVV